MPKSSGVLHVPHFIKGETVALVAGGAGFVGSRLCGKLLERCHVICLDNLQQGKRHNIAPLLSHENFTFIQYDINHKVIDLLRKKVDYIFHVAGVDDVTKGKTASLDELLLHTQGTKNLLEKAVKDKAKFLLVSTLEHEQRVGESLNAAQARLFSESIVTEYIKKFGVDGRVVRVGHLFGPNMSLHTQNPMSILLKDLVEKKEVTIASDPLTRIYPMYIDDCVAYVQDIMFTSWGKGKVINLVSEHSVTLMELANSLQQMLPNTHISFGPHGKHITSFSHTNFDEGKTIIVSSSTSFLAQFVKTLAMLQHSPKQESAFETKSTVQQVKQRVFPWRFTSLLFVGSIVFFSTILPLLIFAATSIIGLTMLNNSYEHIEQGRLLAAQQRATVAEKLFATSETALSTISFHFSLFGRSSDWQGLFLLTKAGEDASVAISHLADGAMLFGEYFKKSIKGQDVEREKLDSAIGEMNAGFNRIPILEKELVDIAALPLPAPLKSYVTKRQALFSEQKATIATAKTLTSMLPDLLGFEGKRTYLVLFQNNMELRPAGGFIGSYGLLTFEKGSLDALDIYDVYQADGQLKGHVEPPAPIRKYLNQPNWYLRDSNWDVDFQKAAAQAAWFLQKEVGTATHGVIAVDVSFAQFLLDATGPISLPDYKETITKENLFEKAETHAESNFFPGSTQKKDFLGALSRRMIDRLLHEDSVSWFAVFDAVQKGLLEKHLLFSFNNAAVQQAFTLNNWGGTILFHQDSEDTFADFRMVNEANLGVNKANFFLTRKVSDELRIDEKGKVTGSLFLQYKNDGPPAWPGGSYVNYVRFFFPLDTKITEITVDGKEASISAKTRRTNTELLSEFALEVDEATESGKSVFGFLMTVPVKTTKVLKIAYELPEPFPLLPGSNTYAYIFQKQPGIREDPLSVLVHYPQTLKLKETNAQVFREKDLVTLSTNLAEDRLFTVEFVR